jgi:hypothetical protein
MLRREIFIHVILSEKQLRFQMWQTFEEETIISNMVKEPALSGTLEP